MQNKKYQIFVSSTYEDLKEERKAVIENILSIGHLPVGMELFVASDDEQFEYIKKIINNCDYYVLILGGRYGSINKKTGISYTQMEFEYAKEKGIPILVFPYKNIEKLPKNKKDTDLTNIKNFIGLASTDRLCKFWSSQDNLVVNVNNSLHFIFDEKPQKGWIRPDEYDNSELLKDLNSAHKRIQELEKQIAENKKALVPKFKDIAGMDEEFEINYTYDDEYQNSFKVSWNEIFSFLAPKMITPISITYFRKALGIDFINKHTGFDYYDIEYNEDDMNTIEIQFIALGLMEIYAGKTRNDITSGIKLTQKGFDYLQEIKTVKTNKK